MKRTLRKPTAKKALVLKMPVKKLKHYHTDAEILFLFAAVLTLFFSVLSSQALGSILLYDAALQSDVTEIKNYVDNVELRVSNGIVLDQLNSLNK